MGTGANTLCVLQGIVSGPGCWSPEGGIKGYKVTVSITPLLWEWTTGLTDNSVPICEFRGSLTSRWLG